MLMINFIGEALIKNNTSADKWEENIQVKITFYKVYHIKFSLFAGQYYDTVR